MGKLTIYRSRESIDKENFIYNSIKENTKQGAEGMPNRTIVIVPDQYTLAAERQAMKRLGTSVLLDVEITGISRLGLRLMKETGTDIAMGAEGDRDAYGNAAEGGDESGGEATPGDRDAKTLINKYGRHMLISRILTELDAELTAFKGYSRKETFIEAINDFISAAKQHQVTPGSLMMLGSSLAQGNSSAADSASPQEVGASGAADSASPQEVGASGSEAFVRKLRDLAIIFARYQEKLKDKYTDNEDLIDLFAEAAAKSDLLKESSIWVYGFDSYTPKNLQFIMALAERSKEVNIHLIFDSNSGDEDLFTLSGRMTETIRNHGANHGVEVSVIDIKARAGELSLGAAPTRAGELSRGVAPGLATLEKELFSVGRAKYRDSTGIEIVKCGSMYQEAEAAAAYVLRLLREENYRFQDIVMICNDQEVRSAIIGRVFSEFGMDIFDDKKRDALGSPVAVYVLSLLEILAYNYRSPDVIRFLKTGLTDIRDEDIYELENYVTKYRVKGSMWLKPFLRGGHERRYAAQSDGYSLLEEVEQTHQRLMTIIQGIKEIYDDARTYGEFAQRYMAYLSDDQNQQSDFVYRIQELIARQEEAGLLEEAEATAQMWDILNGLFDQIAEIMDDEVFDGEGFASLLRSGLSQMEVGVLPPTVDDILLGTMQRTRSGDCKAMLVIGANDDMIPRTAEENILFSREELEVLEEDDQPLGLDSDLRLMEENLAIYRNLSKPTEHLWISYSTTNQKGDEARPSEIISRIHKIFPGLKEQDNSALREDALAFLGGHINTLRRYTETLRTRGPSVGTGYAAGAGVVSGAGAGTAGISGGADVAAGAAPGTAGPWPIVEEWLSKTDHEILTRVKKALQFDNIQKPLPKELAAGLYSKYINDSGEYIYKFSPTALEKYSRCPFEYFISYGLGPDELRRDEVGARDIGELYHNTLQRFTESVGRANRWKEISRPEADSMVETLAREWAEGYRSKLFDKTGSETYWFNRALRACQFVAWTLVQQARSGEIKESYFETVFGGAQGKQEEVAAPSKQEAEAPGRLEVEAARIQDGNELHLKPIIKNLPQGKAYIQGKIDRIDILADDRVKIIDYKTGRETFDVEEVKAGYRLQLMLYLQAAQEETRKPAGVFYFLISEPELELTGPPPEKSLGDEAQTGASEEQREIEDKLRRNYRMEGLMIDSDEIIKEIAGDIFDDAGEPKCGAESSVVKLKRKKDGDLDKYSLNKIMTEPEFNQLQNTVDMIATELCKDITAGRIDLKPKKSGSSKPCDYCGYKSICRFDTIFPGCRYEVVK